MRGFDPEGMTVHDGMPHLSQRQLDILEHMARTGDGHRATGEALGISEQTVKNHLTLVYRVLGTKSLVQTFIALGKLRW